MNQVRSVYPYEYMESWERFDEESLPPKGAFFSKGKDIDDDDYQHAKTAWEKAAATLSTCHHKSGANRATFPLDTQLVGQQGSQGTSTVAGGQQGSQGTSTVAGSPITDW
ncbi:hypothetical protein ACOMHN_036676 [Nucella lapillus]